MGNALGIGNTRTEDEEGHGGEPARLYAIVDGGREASAGAEFRAAQGGAQRIVDRFGLRPVYLLDGAAAPAAGYERLRRLLERHACAVGVRLPEQPDERTLRTLVRMIQENLQVAPLFFEAGRTDVGPRALETLAGLGTAVDLGALADAVTLAPASVPAEDQIRLVRTMIGRGRRTFALRYGGLSSVTEEVFAQRIETVCRFFFEEMGGLPGNPADLVPLPMRERVWPRQERADAMTRPGAVAVPNGE